MRAHAQHLAEGGADAQPARAQAAEVCQEVDAERDAGADGEALQVAQVGVLPAAAERDALLCARLQRQLAQVAQHAAVRHQEGQLHRDDTRPQQREAATAPPGLRGELLQKAGCDDQGKAKTRQCSSLALVFLRDVPKGNGKPGTQGSQ